MTIVYAVPSNPTPDLEINIWAGMPMSWVGADDSEWSLTDRQQGIAMKPGVRGLLMPAYTRYSSQSPAVPGSRHKGSRALDREVMWPVKVFHGDGSISWMRRDRAFWQSLDPDKEGTWTVHHPDGATRSLQCRYIESDDSLDLNPIKLGWQTYQIRLLADSPFWLGQSVTRSWRQETETNFYSEPLFVLASGSSLGSATFSNEGDEPAYPVWTGIGPFTALSVGVEGQTLTVPFSVAVGQAVEIDTHPVTGQRLWSGDWDGERVVNRVNRTSELSGDQRFAPIPAGDSRVLSLTMTGTGTVKASITPAYRRAW